MRKAFKNVKRNRGAAEIDKVSIQMFEANLDEDLDALMRDLKTRSKFQPKPLRRALIPKGRGKMRPLGYLSGTRPNCTSKCCDSFCRLPLRTSVPAGFVRGFPPVLFPVRDCHSTLPLERTPDLWQQGYKAVPDAEACSTISRIWVYGRTVQRGS